MVHLHCHLLILWTFVLGAHVTSSSLTSLSFVAAIEGSVDSLGCLADLFPLNGRFGHGDKLELLEDLDASFNEILITDRHDSVTNAGAFMISRAQRHIANRHQLLHLTLTMKWLLHLTGSFLMQYMAVGYSPIIYSWWYAISNIFYIAYHDYYMPN